MTTMTIRGDEGLTRAYITFNFAAVENGFVLGEYDIATDEYRTQVARTTAEFKTLLLKWQADRIHDIIAWAEKKESEFKK